MNEHDSERIAGLLAEDGMTEAASADEADLILFNTCCIRENADEKLYGQLTSLKPLKEANPNLQIAVGGCLAQKDRGLIAERASFVDVVFGTHNLHRVTDLLAASQSASDPIVEIFEEHEAYPSVLPARRDVDHAAWITIQIGCDNSCTFCIVPSVRGAEVSRRVGDVVHEVEEFAQDGVSEITLLGQNVNSYGRDLGAGQYQPQFADLLAAVGAVDGIRRVRFTSPHPKDLRPETIAAMATIDSVCEHLHLPLQSGSDRVLAAMHRGYTAQRYLERLAAARSEIDDLAVTTDIIIGFPGETEEDFRATLEVAAEADYDSAYTFIYSPREGTPAALMVDQFVEANVVADRMERLKAVVEASAIAKHAARVGRTEEVLVEGPSKNNPEQWSGRTRQNKLVHFAPPPHLEIGSYGLVTVTSAAPHFLRGEWQELTAQPRPPRKRIPLAVV